jgi:hypothetical protein
MDFLHDNVKSHATTRALSLVQTRRKDDGSIDRAHQRLRWGARK